MVGTTDSKRHRMNGGPTTVRSKGKRRTGQKTQCMVLVDRVGNHCRVEELRLSEDRQKPST